MNTAIEQMLKNYQIENIYDRNTFVYIRRILNDQRQKRYADSSRS